MIAPKSDRPMDYIPCPAAVAELVDARRSGRRVRKDVGVRLPPAASPRGLAAGGRRPASGTSVLSRGRPPGWCRLRHVASVARAGGGEASGLRHLVSLGRAAGYLPAPRLLGS